MVGDALVLTPIDVDATSVPFFAMAISIVTTLDDDEAAYGIGIGTTHHDPVPWTRHQANSIP
jgi:hypothetical protein